MIFKLFLLKIRAIIDVYKVVIIAQPRINLRLFQSSLSKYNRVTHLNHNLHQSLSLFQHLDRYLQLCIDQFHHQYRDPIKIGKHHKTTILSTTSTTSTTHTTIAIVIIIRRQAQGKKVWKAKIVYKVLSGEKEVKKNHNLITINLLFKSKEDLNLNLSLRPSHGYKDIVYSILKLLINKIPINCNNMNAINF